MCFGTFSRRARSLATIHIFAQVRIKKAPQDHGITPHLTVLFDCVVFN